MYYSDEGHYVVPVQAFLGSCKGVALIPRDGDPNTQDPGFGRHVSFVILTEDDDRWYASEGSTSSVWLEDLAVQLQVAVHWVEGNCEPDIHEGHQHGWLFKE